MCGAARAATSCTDLILGRSGKPKPADPGLGVAEDRDLVVLLLSASEVVIGDIGVERPLRHTVIWVPAADQHCPESRAILPAPAHRGPDPCVFFIPVQPAGVALGLLRNVKGAAVGCGRAFPAAVVDGGGGVVTERLVLLPLPWCAGISCMRCPD